MTTSTATAIAAAPAPKDYSVPWTKPTGKRCPLPADAPVMVDLGDGHLCIGFAGSFAWALKGPGAVRRFAPLLPVAYAAG